MANIVTMAISWVYIHCMHKEVNAIYDLLCMLLARMVPKSLSIMLLAVEEIGHHTSMHPQFSYVTF